MPPRMRFHVVMDRYTGEVVKVEEVSDDFSFSDAIAHRDQCKALSPEELDSAVAVALQSSPRWRRRQRGAR
jgi:hypothetical protein